MQQVRIIVNSHLPGYCKVPPLASQKKSVQAGVGCETLNFSELSKALHSVKKPGTALFPEPLLFICLAAASIIFNVLNTACVED